MARTAGKIFGLMIIGLAASDGDASAKWGRRPGQAQPTGRPATPGSVLGQAIRIAPRIPGVLGIPGMPRIPGVPGLPGVGSLPGLVGKLR